MLQLQEETDPLQGEGEGREGTTSPSPMASIEIQTFKMLNLVREQARNNIAASERNNDSQGGTVATITTVRKPCTSYQDAPSLVRDAVIQALTGLTLALEQLTNFPPFAHFFCSFKVRCSFGRLQPFHRRQDVLPRRRAHDKSFPVR